MLLYASLCLGVFFLSLNLLALHRSAQVVATFSGSRGLTTTEVFQVNEPSWRIEVTYFRNWSPFWSLEVHVLRTEQDIPLFSTRVIRYVDFMGQESWVPESQPSLAEGRYFLRLYSIDVDWTIRVVKGKL